MSISIPPDAEQLARAQAAAAGFSSVDAYLENLVRRQTACDATSRRGKALDELRLLRKELPKLSATEIVRSLHEARADLS
jgi:hypothetical protein